MPTLAITLRDQRKQHAISEIADTALELFIERGFSSTSVEDIAVAAGCSPRTFYRYFGAKEEVLFHDLPAQLERLARNLDRHLAGGLEPWRAVTEALVALISRFDDGAEMVAVHRMELWLHEPALRGRYVQFVVDAENVVSDALRRYRGTTSKRDDLAMLMAVAAISAYRVTVVTHHPNHEGLKLAKHLRQLLAVAGGGLSDERPAHAPPTARTHRLTLAEKPQTV